MIDASVIDASGAVPALVALILSAVAVALVVFAVRSIRRSSRVRAAADDAVASASARLLRLDDAVDELDLAFEAADADDVGDLSADLRRARTSAHRARDRGFADLSDLDEAALVPATRRQRARRLAERLDGQLADIARTRQSLTEWARTHRTRAGLLAAARDRRDRVTAASGDPEPLLSALRTRYDRADWLAAEESAHAATEAITEADAALSGDPDDDALLRAAHALRRAALHLRAVEDAHRITVQAAENAEPELRAARDELDEAIRAAQTQPDRCPPGAAERLRAARTALDDATVAAERRPREAIVAVARARELRDQMIGAVSSPRRRLEAARAALPGTLACARAALARVETSDDERPIADRRRLETARRELAAARAATDAETALANARAAWNALTPPS